jgi:hypothetical protein
MEMTAGHALINVGLRGKLSRSMGFRVDLAALIADHG